MEKNQIRILLAEDNTEHQHLLLLALVEGRSNVSVTVVGTGEEFLRLYRTKRFDCAITDYNLPDYTADQLLELLNRESKTIAPILIVSSNEMQSVVISSIRQGCVDFVPKKDAVLGDELWTRVQKAMAVHRQSLLRRRKMERRTRYLAKLAETDPLTLLMNRRHFERCLGQRRWRNDRRKYLACAMIDIDHFKQLNDQFGHTVGDEALKTTAKYLADQNDAHTVIRWGGEEFLILAPGLDELDAWIWAERLRADIEAMTLCAEGQDSCLTVSIGLVVCESSNFSHDVIDRADRALYLAKHRGRNNVATDRMVDLVAMIEQIKQNGSRDPEARWRHLISQLAGRLGPVQREHITIHCRQVSQRARQIAQTMNLSSQEVEHIRLGGLIHDIGKCLIPERLLAKPQVLNVEEWRLMAGHDQLSHWIAQQLEMDPTVAQIIRHHHARYDSELNRGASDDDNLLPLGARVLCVADALATMLTTRTYRSASSVSDVLLEMQRQRGRQFDPLVVDAVNGLLPRMQLLAA